MGGNQVLAVERQQQRCATGGVERLTIIALPDRVPGHNHTERVIGAEAGELLEPEGEVADRRPDIPPLLAFEALTSRNDRCERAERHDVLREERPSARV